MASVIKVDQIQSDSGSVAFTGNTSFDTNTVYIDSVNDRVGFGTSNPAYKYDFKTSGNSSGGGIALTNTDTDSSSWVMMPDYNISGGEASGLNIIRSGTGIYMKIDRSGRVTMPYQPAFHAYKATTANFGQNVTIVYDNVFLNRGSHYSTSTGRFTAPVAGAYFFAVTNNSYQTGGDILLRKNGSNIVGIEFDPSGAPYWMGSSCQAVMTLAAGDYVDVIFTVSTTYAVEGHPWNGFCGYLIG